MSRKREPGDQDERLLDVDASLTRSGGQRLNASTSPVTHARPDFTVFYRQTYPNVARALAITLGDRELGAEAADEAMARCYSRWSTVQDYDNPAGWVYRVGLNWARSFLRRAARRLAPPAAGAVEPPDMADPQIHEALEELDIRLRSVIVCRFLFDWSIQDTADALNLRPGTVKSRVHRALAVLEDKLYHLR